MSYMVEKSEVLCSCHAQQMTHFLANILVSLTSMCEQSVPYYVVSYCMLSRINSKSMRYMRANASWNKKTMTTDSIHPSQLHIKNADPLETVWLEFVGFIKGWLEKWPKEGPFCCFKWQQLWYGWVLQGCWDNRQGVLFLHHWCPYFCDLKYVLILLIGWSFQHAYPFLGHDPSRLVRMRWMPAMPWTTIILFTTKYVATIIPSKTKPSVISLVVTATTGAIFHLLVAIIIWSGHQAVVIVSVPSGITHFPATAHHA